MLSTSELGPILALIAPSPLKLHHISKNPSSNIFFDRKMEPLANGTLCLNTPKHNGKSGTAWSSSYFIGGGNPSTWNASISTVKRDHVIMY
jgi:hypothetical protein